MLIIAEQFHASDLGRQRQGNEDNYFVRAPLFVVADGMGGAQAGEVASEMAVESFDPELPDGSPAETLVAVIQDANRRIHERSRADEQAAGMGTTCTAAYVGESEVTIAHVGDSRAYLWRDGELTRLTRDHSLVGELVARGKLTEEQAEAHPQRSVITRALGPEADVQVDVETFGARPGDVYLLCSDGLTSMIHEVGVKPIFESTNGLEHTGRALISAANEAGGRDNITVILFRLDEVERPGAPSGAGAEAAAGDAEGRTIEYDTFAGEVNPDPRQGVSKPTGHTRERDGPRAPTSRRGARGRRDRGGLPGQRHRRAVGGPAPRGDAGGATAPHRAAARGAWSGRRATGEATTTAPHPIGPGRRPRPARDARRRLLARHARGLLRRRRRRARQHRDDLPWAADRAPAGDGALQPLRRLRGHAADDPRRAARDFTNHKLRAKDDAENLLIQLERGQLDS